MRWTAGLGILVGSALENYKTARNQFGGELYTAYGCFHAWSFLRKTRGRRALVVVVGGAWCYGGALGSELQSGHH